MPEERGERSVSSIGLGHARVATLSYEDMENLKDLGVAVLAIVNDEVNSELERVLQFAQSLPVEDFYNAPEPRAFSGGNASPEKVRKRLGEG